MANRPLEFRVPEAERPAWERVLAMIRDLGVEQAEQRLSATDQKAITKTKDQRGHGAGDHPEPSWPEKRLASALGRRAGLIQKQATRWIGQHGLPDNAENRVAATLDRLDAWVRRAADRLEQTYHERREVEREITALREDNACLLAEWSRLSGEARKARSSVATANADLAAARRKANDDWRAEYDRQMRGLQAKGYLPDESPMPLRGATEHENAVGAGMSKLSAGACPGRFPDGAAQQCRAR